MRALFFFTLFLGAHSVCPPQYQLMEGRCIRSLYPSTTAFALDDSMGDFRKECGKDGARLPIIKSDEENDSFNKITRSLDPYPYTLLVLDMICNAGTRRLEWVDGTSINYVPKHSSDPNYDCINVQSTLVSDPFHNDWTNVATNLPYFVTVLCVANPALSPTEKPVTTSVKPTQRPTEQPDSDQCGEYSLMDVTADYKHPCFKLYTYPATWETAARVCSAGFASLVTINSDQENKYFFRTAVSMNAVHGMHIGAHQSTDDPKLWTWSDGEKPINGSVYKNFISSFPIPGAGSCVAMMTDNPSATWINEDCKQQPLPFMCRRIDFSSMPKECPTDAPKTGEDIFSPGLPFPDIPCEYVLFVDENRLVELEVITLVADSKKDYLVIYEKPTGNALLANLTGTILSPIKIKTQVSNVMRVSWRPNGEGKGRGFRIRYNEAGS